MFWGSICIFISCSQWNELQSSLGPDNAILMQIAKYAQATTIQIAIHILVGSLCTSTYFEIGSAYTLYTIQLYVQ